MFTLQSLMLVALGILVASLLVVAILPSYRARVRRLTSDEIRSSIPLTEAEIRADKDKLRAQFAIRVHKLEAEGEQQKLAAARQRIELNRRDARITELQDDMERVRAALEENVNARRVLEHTVTDRLPRLEQQLDSARMLIEERDHEMVQLKTETTRSVRALDEAMQMNAQQRAELERISSSMAARTSIPRESYGDPKFDGELALRSEIEALRAKTREQAGHILRLQSGPGDQETATGAPDVDRLKRELADAEQALRASRDSAQSGSFDRAAAEAQSKALHARIDEQAAEIARLNAALVVYEGAADTSAASDRRIVAQGSRLAAKAQISSLQAQLAQQTETIQRLRSELAASNERLARQAAHYVEEMRRLGAGTVPMSIDPRRGRDAPRRSLADRIAQTARPAVAPAVASEDATAAAAAGSTAAVEFADELAGSDVAPGAQPLANGTSVPNGHTDAGPGEVQSEPPKRKLRLLERIASAGKA